MIIVNLLHKNEQVEYKEEMLRRILVLSSFVLSFVIIICVILGTIIYTDLAIQTGLEEKLLNDEQKSEQGKKIVEIEKRIIVLNTKIATIAGVQKNTRDLIPLILTLDDLVAPGITLKDLSVDTTTRSIALSGNAKERKDLENLRDKITANLIFEQIDLPIASLLKQKNIEFSIHFIFKQEP